MKKNIVLTGFMTAGKSKVSRLLSDQLSWPRLSTDEFVEMMESQLIKDIFSSKGEAYFRFMESWAVKQASEEQSVIIDCGGGVVTNPYNMKELKRYGTVFYLKVTPETVLRRLKLKRRKAKRPLLNVKDPLKAIHDLMRQRERAYLKADHVIDANSDDIAQHAKKILKLMKL